MKLSLHSRGRVLPSHPASAALCLPGRWPSWLWLLRGSPASRTGNRKSLPSNSSVLAFGCGPRLPARQVPVTLRDCILPEPDSKGTWGHGCPHTSPESRAGGSPGSELRMLEVVEAYAASSGGASRGAGSRVCDQRPGKPPPLPPQLPPGNTVLGFVEEKQPECRFGSGLGSLLAKPPKQHEDVKLRFLQVKLPLNPRYRVF